MPRKKREHYEWVPKLNLYRKRIKDVDGKYVPIYAKTEAEMDAKVEEAKKTVAAGLAAKENPTVRQYAQQWLALNTAGMKYKYKESVTNSVNLHIIPVIGDLYMRDVRESEAKLVMLALAGKSNSLQSKVLSAMRNIFRSAIRDRIIQENPCEDIKAGGAKAPKKTALSEKQIQVLEDAVKGTKAETFVLLGLYTGMRREEILALRWEFVNLDGKAPHLYVRKALHWENNQPVVEDTMKTDAAYRTIPIPSKLLENLKQYSEKTGYVIGGEKPLTSSRYRDLWATVEARQTGEKTYTDYDKDGKPRKVTFVRKLGAKCKGGNWYYTIDFDVHPHLLRHTYITNLIMGGVPLKRVQYLAGHADIKITLEIYTHLIENSPEALKLDVDRVWG